MARKPEIGSIFPAPRLRDIYAGRNGGSVNECAEAHLMSLCREALLAIAQNLSFSGKRVCLPAYTCQTVIDPFLQMGYECFFYGIRPDLSIDKESFESLLDAASPSVVLVHPYYGMDFLDEEIALIEEAKKTGAEIIGDYTQCIFSQQKISAMDYRVGSLRKWFPIPDGAFLCGECASINARSIEENSTFVSRQFDAMELRRMYFEYGDTDLKSVSRRVNKDAEELACETIALHSMSDVSRMILGGVDFEMVQEKRLENCRYLFDKLSGCHWASPVYDSFSRVGSAPSYFPVYLKNRKEAIVRLANQGIYVPVLWPVESNAVLITDGVREIYENIAALPCDQRYGLDDMARIVDAILQMGDE